MPACDEDPAPEYDPWCDGPVSTLLSREDQEHIGEGMPTSRPAGFVRVTP